MTSAADIGAAGPIAAGVVERQAFIEGIALWSPTWPGWACAAAALRDEPESNAAIAGAPGAQLPHAEATRPAPRGLAANERRRAPDSVLVALHVAEQAVAMSGHAASTLPSIFTSAHGDLRIVDGLLRTLAAEPQSLSPTRFHHAVHNAPSGYWAMASGSHAASTALAAYDHSFGAGLLEALVQLATEERALLLAGCDTEARGPLASVNSSQGLLGVALVLAPRPSATTRFALDWQLRTPGPANVAISRAARALAGNALGDAVPLFEALAQGRAGTVAMRCGPGQDLQVALRPWPRAG